MRLGVALPGTSTLFVALCMTSGKEAVLWCCVLDKSWFQKGVLELSSGHRTIETFRHRTGVRTFCHLAASCCGTPHIT